jgi:two-component system cell cycle sensor histidine kinase/response regulator CckA
MNDDFRVLFDANPRAMFVFDRDTLAFLHVNDAMCALYEWSRDELLGMTLRDIRPPEDVPRFEHAFAEMQQMPTPPQRTSRHRTRTGRELEVVLDMARVTFGGAAATLAVVTDVTGVREMERRFKVLVEHSQDGVSIMDDRGRVVYLSPAGERLLGLEPGQLNGHDSTEPIHPDDRPVPECPPGQTRTYLNRARHVDGSWRWIEATGTNLKLDPEVRGYVSSFRDVTARVEAEHALRESNRRFELLMSATSAITFSARAGGGFGATYMSPNVRDVLGWEASDFVGDDAFWFAHLHPDDRAPMHEQVAILLERGSNEADYRFQHRNGSWRWMHSAVRLTRDDVGQPFEIVGYIIDITDHKRAEESLRRSEANFRELIERSPFAVLVHRGGLFVYVNPAAVAMLGYGSADELVGTAVLDLVHPDDRDAVRTRMAHTMKYGSGAPGEARMRRRDGSYVVSEGEGLLLDFDGQPSNVVVGRDVTERRELYARMAVADRMMSVGTLAAGVAHEINNPLAYVSSNLEVLARELAALREGKPTQLDRGGLEPLVKDALDGAERVAAIVRSLRALSRSDDETVGAVELESVLASCIKIAHNEIRHRARVVQQIAPELPPIEGNASRLGQVFLNLLVNAAQAIPEGHAGENEIRVRAFHDADARRVVVEVEDTGAGIPRSLIGRIFDPFFTTKPIGAGIGLGLSISHEIVRSLGGTITVDSAVGVGTTFHVALPVAIAQVSPAGPAAAPEPGTVARVLVIDDEVAVGRSIALLLAPDYEVTPVTRAKDALARLAAGERYDAVVCDVMMPEMNGIDFFEQLKQAAPEQVRRVVFLTGGAFTQQARDFLASAARPQLGKPFTERDLRRVIASVAGGA